MIKVNDVHEAHGKQVLCRRGERVQHNPHCDQALVHSWSVSEG